MGAGALLMLLAVVEAAAGDARDGDDEALCGAITDSAAVGLVADRGAFCGREGTLN